MMTKRRRYCILHPFLTNPVLLPSTIRFIRVGYYQDNELQNVNIVINSQFDGFSEVIALSQQAISSAISVFNNNIEIQIQVVTADGVRALLTRNKDSDTFDYVLVD